MDEQPATSSIVGERLVLARLYSVFALLIPYPRPAQAPLGLHKKLTNSKDF